MDLVTHLLHLVELDEEEVDIDLEDLGDGNHVVAFFGKAVDFFLIEEEVGGEDVGFVFPSVSHIEEGKLHQALLGGFLLMELVVANLVGKDELSLHLVDIGVKKDAPPSFHHRIHAEEVFKVGPLVEVEVQVGRQLVGVLRPIFFL